MSYYSDVDVLSDSVTNNSEVLLSSSSEDTLSEIDNQPSPQLLILPPGSSPNEEDASTDSLYEKKTGHRQCSLKKLPEGKRSRVYLFIHTLSSGEERVPSVGNQTGTVRVLIIRLPQERLENTWMIVVQNGVTNCPVKPKAAKLHLC
ncbi:hypothetical protein GEMRC1_000856 [Eukaryota sp. GEM-RC1]